MHTKLYHIIGYIILGLIFFGSILGALIASMGFILALKLLGVAIFFVAIICGAICLIVL